MGMCNNDYETLGKDEFYDHVYKEVSVVADNIASKITTALTDDSDAYQDMKRNEEDYDSAEKEEFESNRQMWKKNLRVDIATLADVRVEAGGIDSSHHEIRKSITDYVHEELAPLKDRAKTLPKPSDAEALTSAVRNRLYGQGYAKGSDAAEGLLGEVQKVARSTENDLLAKWISPAGDVYRSDVLVNMHETVAEEQRKEINTLAHLAELNHGVIRTARKDICKIVHGAATAAEDMDDGCGDGTDGGTEEDDKELGPGAYVGLVLALGAVAAACAPGAAIGWGIALAVGGAGGASIPFFEKALEEHPPENSEKEESELSFAAANWKELITNVAKAANKVADYLDECYTNLDTKANERIDYVMTESNRDRYYVVNGGT